MRATSRQANVGTKYPLSRQGCSTITPFPVKQLSSVLKLGRCFTCDQLPEATSVQASELITCGGSREDVSPGKAHRAMMPYDFARKSQMICLPEQKPRPFLEGMDMGCASKIDR
ncbi:hypothetical protein PGT21_035174 [Puccinia graminis f. sp. tritici]|uniref:Uncharacterized protein n=1 Tax=Puccinia graminis f. sp. tritici TaxID=56615 RepID=A0A5B0Q1N1_PUCGR|nr:hypothetical protein PGT21_035174 [Puccinia graminis f. sp. tritici]KAA1106959.1 hypothetical protein PGTUg99_016523 [Puccinia graminis f. sp. tritici]